MAGELAAMVFTDLLYNVNYGDTTKDNLRAKGGAKAGRTILNDNLGDDFEGILTEACQNILCFTDPEQFMRWSWAGGRSSRAWLYIDCLK